MRNGSVVYFCKRTNKETNTFAKPVELKLKPMYLTIQPISGYNDLQFYGEFAEITHKGIAMPYERWINTFSEGDRFYLKGVPNGYAQDSEPMNGWGDDADAEIIAVKPQNKIIVLTIRDIIR